MVKYYIKNTSQNYEERPCENCDLKWYTTSGGKDERGEYIEVKSCKDNCSKYFKYGDDLYLGESM